MPENDYFQLVKAHSNTSSDSITHGDYLGVERDSGIVFIRYSCALSERKKKKQFCARTADLVKENMSIDEKNLFVVLTENTPADWSLGPGVAQYL
ncbi:tautomerase family protein [Rothia terrae]|uniref:tautomerase family protein n=1 Tax=Rothia terrae TaxID=396015 RepID=UPI0038037656